MSNLVAQFVRLSSSKRQLFTAELKKQGMLLPIAIVGIGCRFPGNVIDADSYWQLLKEGRDAITEVPAERWDINAFYHENPLASGKTNSRWGSFLKDIDKFDAGFFGINGREAARMDPQQRLLLEVAWEAMEDAGVVVEELAGSRTGVFIGIALSDYGRMQIEDLSLSDPYAGTGSAFSIAANRLSYCFDLRGPSMAIDTACSSSLVAVHLACQSLWNNESTAALVGGVNLILSPAVTINFSKTGFLSPDGHCKAFDAQANGYVRGEGCGVILLKPLPDAIDDGDRIYAVIRGSAINQDGKTNGLTAPNRLSQEEVLKSAYQRAAVSPGQIQYIETHGTGTALGDPIEVSALANILSVNRANNLIASIGSVKTNIGHLEAAAGIAGLIKTALSLKAATLPPSIHFNAPNPQINFETLPIRVQRNLEAWPTNATRLAGVSSFGFGGTNAHIVLEGVDETRTAPASHPAGSYLLPISARSEASLRSLAGKYRDYLLENGATNSLYDICYNACLRRSHHNFRLTIAGRTSAELIDAINSYLIDKPAQTLSKGAINSNSASKVVFLFPGQGSQWFGMAQQLLKHESVFARTIAECDVEINREAGWSLLTALQADKTSASLTEIDRIQPALFAIEVALAAMWQDWGVTPAFVVGHSMGEVAASYLAGALTLKDAVIVICRRSRLLKKISGQGAMLAIELSMAKAQDAIAGYENKISIAVSSSPTSTVLSGDRTALSALQSHLESEGIYCRLVNVDVASHSPQVDPLKTELLSLLAEIDPQHGSIPIYSTVTNQVCNGSQFDAEYWAQNLRAPVLFADVIAQLARDNNAIFIEMSPHPILLPAVESSLDYYGYEGCAIASLRRDCDEELMMKTALGRLYCAGYKIDWSRHFPVSGQHLSLPAYAWQKQRYWLEELRHSNRFDGNGGYVKNADPGGHPLLNSYTSSSLQPDTHFWNTVISIARPGYQAGYLAGHQVLGSIVFPAAGYLEMAISAAQQLSNNQHCQLVDIEFAQALYLAQEISTKLQLALKHDAEGEAIFSFSSQAVDNRSWQLHAKGRLVNSNIEQRPDKTFEISELIKSALNNRNSEQFYQHLTAVGLQYQHGFQAVDQIWQLDNAAVGRLRTVTDLELSSNGYSIHPCLLDGCLQLLSATVEKLTDANRERVYLPVAIAQLRFCQAITATNLWAYARLNSAESATITGDLYLLDDNGKPLIEIIGLRLESIDNKQYFVDQQLENCFYQIEWQAAERNSQRQLNSTATNKKNLWLIFGGNERINKNLNHQLSSSHDSVVNINFGESYQASADSYTINYNNLQDFTRLFTELFSTEEHCCRGIVFLSGLSAAPIDRLTTRALEAEITQLSLSLLNLIKSLAGMAWSVAPRCWLITNGAREIENNTIAITQSPLWGLGRVIAHEFPEFSPTNIDLSTLSASQEIDEAELIALAQEIRSNGDEDQIALRGIKRYVARLVNQKLPAAKNVVPVVRADASYLITGGYGGLGLTTAQWLADNGAKYLVLTGRKQPSQQAQVILNQLTESGVKLILATTDIADYDQTAALIDKISAELPPLKGIIHAAGLLDDATLLQLDEQQLSNVLKPKVAGSWNLHTLTLEHSLDFLLCYSSAASLIGAPGQGNYVVANTFLDALAHYRQSAGLPTLSINWGPWSEAGLAVSIERGGRLSVQGIQSFTNNAGKAALSRLLTQSQLSQSQYSQFGCLSINLSQWQQHYPHIARLPYFAALIPEKTGTGVQPVKGCWRDELIKLTDSQERISRLERYVQTAVAQVLRLSPLQVELDQPLQTLGLDSLLAIELRNYLENSLGISVSAATIWNYPTVTRLSEYLATRLNFTATSQSVTEQVTPPVVNSQSRSSELTNLDELSEAEVEALLLSELDKIEGLAGKNINE